MTTDDLSAIRERAAEHQRELDARASFYRIKHLVARWDCSASTVRAIPFSDLPFLELGHGAKHKSRRYRPEDVEAYEALLAERARQRRAS